SYQEAPSNNGFWTSSEAIPDATMPAEEIVTSEPVGFTWEAEEVEITADPIAEMPSTDHYVAPAVNNVLTVDSPEKYSPTASEERTAWALASLVWLDDLFVRGTFKLGKLGFWMRGPSGRTFLGGLGLLGLGIALAFTILERLNWP